jgi:hypothetical protein
MEIEARNMPSPAVDQLVIAEDNNAKGRDHELPQQKENKATSEREYTHEKDGVVDERDEREREESPDILLSKMRSVALVATVAGAAFLNVSLSESSKALPLMLTTSTSSPSASSQW